VGTLAEYLDANLSPPTLSYLDPEARARELGVRFEDGSVIGAGATLGAGASLRRAVVWNGEHIPAGMRVEGGVFARGRFHPAAGPDPATARP
jgi:hypothetical protein